MLGRDRNPGGRVANNDASEASAQVGLRSCKCKYRHHFGSSGDVEAGLARNAVEFGAEAHDDVTQRSVVDVDNATPSDVGEVEAERVALEERVVDHGGQQVVRCGHRVHIAGQVQVERLHRHDLAVAASGRAALDAKGGAHRWLANSDGRLLADVAHGLTEPDGSGGLAFAERSRGNRGDDHVFGLRAVLQSLNGFKLDLGDVIAVGLHELGR